jgi:hypothetical protein
MDPVTKLILCVVFSSIGMGYFIYGKRETRLVAMIAGALLCAFPYCVSNIYLFLAVGILLILAPFMIRE